MEALFVVVMLVIAIGFIFYIDKWVDNTEQEETDDETGY
jgi:Tfp pilus assembly protein PilO